jgi:DNA polymerase V
MFLSLKGFASWEDLLLLGQEIRHTLWQGLHIPVSVGIGSTKTLAKIANFYAKRSPKLEGVYILDNPRRIKVALSKTAIEEVWGIGRKWGAQLRKINIYTAQDLANSDHTYIKRQCNIVLAKTTLELQGISCLDLEQVAPRQSIMVSRSFGQKTDSYEDLREAIANFASLGAEKLREQASYACAIVVFIRTNFFNEKDAQYSNSLFLKFPKETDNTLIILQTAWFGLKKIYKPDFLYKKAGILLQNIISKEKSQYHFFIDEKKMQQQPLMQAMDAINHKYGRQTIRLAGCGVDTHDSAWSSQQDKVSPAYTTQWEDILIVQAN